MNLNLEKIFTDNGTVYLKLSIAEKELSVEVDKKLKKLQSTAMVKGFRKGHAPLNMLKSMHGKEVSSEIFSRLFQEKLDEEINNDNAYIGTALLHQYPPEVLLESFKEDMENGILSAFVEIGYFPDFELKGFDKSMVLDYYVVNDTHEIAKKQLESDLMRHAAPITLPEGTPVNEKDIVVLRLQELDDQQLPKEGGLDVENSFALEYTSEVIIHTLLSQTLGSSFIVNPRQLDVGSADNDVFFRKYIMHLEANDDREIGENYLATILEIKRIPELSEETIKATFGESASSEKLLNIIETALKTEVVNAQNDMAFNHLFESLIEKNPYNISDEYLLNLQNSEDSKESKAKGENTPEENAARLLDFSRQQIFRKAAKDIEAEPTAADYKEHARSLFTKQSPYMMLNISDELLEQISGKDDKFKKNHRQDLFFRKSMALMLEKVTLKEIPISLEEFSELARAGAEQYNAE